MRDIFSCMMVWFYVLVYFFLHYFTTKVCRSYSVWWKQVLVKKDPYKKCLHGATWKVLEEKTASIPAQGYYILILEFDFILDRIESAHHWIFVDVIIPPGL